MGLPGGMRSGSPEALAWALRESEAAREVGEVRAARTSKAVAARNAEAFPKFFLRKVADQLGVDLTTVKGSGSGGMIMLGDIQAAAPTAAAVGQIHERSTGPFARNPLVAAAYRDRPGEAVQAASRGPAPTMFTGGDLPAFTASGVDPRVLLQVPWNARYDVAAETSAAKVFQVVEEFNGCPPDEAEAMASTLGLDRNKGVDAYKARVRDWLVYGLTDTQLYDAMFPERQP